MEQFALNTTDTLEVVNRHGIVTLMADYTQRSPEIRRWLERFESESIPLTVIFPGNQPDKPIVIRDVYTKRTLLAKLQEAVSVPPQTAAQASVTDAEPSPR